MTLTQIKFIAGGLAALGLVGIWLYVGRIQARAELAEERALALLRENLALTLNVEDNQRALADRERESRRLAIENAALAEKLREVYDHDPEARAWADCPLPSSVECLLR